MGIGSKLKKLARKVIPKETAAIAPIVSVFNPAIGAALGAAGGLREGNIGKAVMGGLTNYGLGSFARGAGMPQFGQGLSSGLGNILKGIPGVSTLTGSPIGQGIGSIFQNIEGLGGNVGKMLQTSIGNTGMGGTGQVTVQNSAGDVFNTTAQEAARNPSLKIISEAAGTGASSSGGLGSFVQNLLTGEGGGGLTNDLLMRSLIGGGSYLAEKKDLEEAKRLAEASGETKSLAQLAEENRLAPIQYAEGGEVDPRNIPMPMAMGMAMQEPDLEMTAAEGIMGPMQNVPQRENPVFEGGIQSYEDGGRVNAFLGGLFGGDKNFMEEENAMAKDPEYMGWKNIFEQSPELATTHPRHMEFKKYYDSVGKAMGGRIGYQDGGQTFQDIITPEGKLMFERLTKEMGMTDKEAMQNMAEMGESGSMNLGNVSLMDYFANQEAKEKGGVAGLEMDARVGGFIPIGAKERADDVPARLSKNEFVMTADAVRGFGNGSVNKGAKKMYDMMYKLEEQGKRA